MFIHPLQQILDVRLYKCSTFCPPTFLCIGCMVYWEHMAITALPLPRNQGPERGLFVLRQKNFADMFFSWWKAGTGSSFEGTSVVFQAAVSTKLRAVCACATYYLSLSFGGGKPRMEHKNASLCVYVCVSTGVHFVSTAAHVHKRDGWGAKE